MKMLHKLIPVEVKELGDRVLEIAGSTEDVDRMGDVIRASGWKLAPFKKNPVFMWAHDYSQPPIGRALKVWVDKETNKLMFNVEFAGPDVYEFADTIYKLYKGGFLHATSVGFIPLNWVGKDEENPSPKWEGNEFTSQELLELSAVPVPANADALVSARDGGIITTKEFEYLTSHKITVTKPEETDDTIRIPVKEEEGKHEDCEIKTIKIDKDHGISALYCVDDKVIITYLFDKEKGDWTMETAQTWVEDHSKSVDSIIGSTKNEPESLDIAFLLASIEEHKVREVSQAQLKDDIDYMITVIDSSGLSDDAMPKALALAGSIIWRSTGNDIPDNILTKVGAVLNAKNKGRLTQIQELAQAVLDSAATPDDSGKELGPPIIVPTPAELQRQRVLDVAEVAQVVIAKLRGKRIY